MQSSVILIVSLTYGLPVKAWGRRGASPPTSPVRVFLTCSGPSQVLWLQVACSGPDPLSGALTVPFTHPWLLPGGPARPCHAPSAGLSTEPEDGPLVKCRCLIFLAQTLLAPTPCNDTGVNRAPGTIIIRVERQESPGGSSCRPEPPRICPQRGALQSDLCLRSRWVQTLRPAFVWPQPRGYFPFSGADGGCDSDGAWPGVTVSVGAG